jgi:hypothetical protein
MPFFKKTKKTDAKITASLRAFKKLKRYAEKLQTLKDLKAKNKGDVILELLACITTNSYTFSSINQIVQLHINICEKGHTKLLSKHRDKNIFTLFTQPKSYKLLIDLQIELRRKTPAATVAIVAANLSLPTYLGP